MLGWVSGEYITFDKFKKQVKSLDHYQCYGNNVYKHNPKISTLSPLTQNLTQGFQVFTQYINGSNFGLDVKVCVNWGDGYRYILSCSRKKSNSITCNLRSGVEDGIWKIKVKSNGEYSNSKNLILRF